VHRASFESELRNHEALTISNSLKQEFSSDINFLESGAQHAPLLIRGGEPCPRFP
jgi:hypothetical protein